MTKVTDQWSVWGRGNRGPVADGLGGNGVITAWSSTFPGSPNWGLALDGGYGNSGPNVGFHTPSTSEEAQFTFDAPVICRGLQAIGGDDRSHGYYQPWGSNDGGATRVNLGSPFNWLIANSVLDSVLYANANNGTRGLIVTWDNDDAYTTYGFTWTSGGGIDGRPCCELEFLIEHEEQDAGDRTALITVTTSSTEVNGRALSKLVDGDNDQSNLHSPTDLRLDPFAPGDYIQFVFTDPITIKRAFMQRNGGSDLGDFKWAQSPDAGGSWLDSGSTFAVPSDGTPRDIILDGSDPSDVSTHWRLIKVGGSNVNMQQLYEIFFELAVVEYTYDPGPQPPHGYSDEVPIITTNIGTYAGDIDSTYDGGEGARATTLLPTWTPDFAVSGGSSNFDGATGGQGNLDCYIAWEFENASAVGTLQYRATLPASLGDWQLEGSQSGDSDKWHPIGAPFTLIGNTAAGVKNQYVNGGMNVPLPFGPQTGAYQTKDIDGVVYTDTLFYKHFRIRGVSSYIPPFPFEQRGRQQIACLALMASEYLDRVEIGPEIPPAPTGIIPPDDPGATPAEPVEPTSPDDPTYPEPLPSDYRSPYSRGNRGPQLEDGDPWATGGNGLVNIVADTFSDKISGPEKSLDNKFSGGPYYGSLRGNGHFDFEFDKPVYITALKFFLEGLSAMNSGTWRVLGSNDNFTISYVLSSVQAINLHENTDTSDDVATGYYETELLIDLSPGRYKSYRLEQIAVGPDSGRLWNEIYFKVSHDPVEGGDRRSGDYTVNVTTNKTNLSINNVATTDVTSLVDGIQYVATGPDNANKHGIRSAGTAPRWVEGDYFQFQFPRAVILMRGFLQIAEGHEEAMVSGLPTRWGLWQWRGSDNGEDFYDVGDPFAFGDGETNATCDGGNRELAYGYWRLELIDTFGATVNNENGELYQMEFDLVDVGTETEIPSVWASVEANDTMTAYVSVSSPGEVIGDLAAVEDNDVMVAYGFEAGFGIWRSTESPDVFSAYIKNPIIVVMAATEASDRMQAAGIGYGVDGVLVATEEVDIFAASVVTPITAQMSAVEAPDRFVALGAGVLRIRRRPVFIVT